MVRLAAGAALLLISPLMSAEQPFPASLIVARHTYVDFGPPLDYYEIFAVDSTANGCRVERIQVTPPGAPCVQPAKVDVSTAMLAGSISELLGGKNPCAIPEKELRRERKRCKNCLVFSGADVVMQVQCGEQTRRIRTDIFDRDLFDPAPRTPEHTSWTMSLLQRFDQALGSAVRDQPIFTLNPAPEAPPALPESKYVTALSNGDYDAIFAKAPDKMSELYVASRRPLAQPAIRLLDGSPTLPNAFLLPQYPPIARLARIEGNVSFTLKVRADGSVEQVTFTGGHVLLHKAVEFEALKWKFPPEAYGKTLPFVIEFKTNCH